MQKNIFAGNVGKNGNSKTAKVINMRTYRIPYNPLPHNPITKYTEVKESRIHGLGLFAKTTISKGTIWWHARPQDVLIISKTQFLTLDASKKSHVMEEFIKNDQEIRELENKKIIRKEKKITIKKNEKDWLKKAILKEQQEKENEKIRKAEEKRKEKIRKLKEKKQQKKAENKDKLESDKFPSRTDIIEHTDSLELVIKPYPFWKLYKKIFGLFRGWEFVNMFILTYAAPAVVWLGIIGALWEFINLFKPDITVMILLRIASVFLVLGLVGFGFLLVYTIFTRSKYFETLNIRVSTDGMCAFYHIKPEKPYYVGPVSGISLKIITPGKTLPAGKGKESKNWADIEIKVPEKDYEFYHTGFSTKDISVLQSFLRKTGKWKKTPRKHK